LDEIGDMPMDAQTRLLRVLQQGEYMSVGGRTPIRTDVRIVAASNKNLKELIEKGMFREDLYYRLNVVPLRLPPLRERPEDIADLVRHFFAIGATEGLPAKTMDNGALEIMAQYNWPGNVRELENMVRRFSALYSQELITADLVRQEIADQGVSAAELKISDNLGVDLKLAVETYLRDQFSQFTNTLPPPGLYQRVLLQVEEPLILAALAATRGNQIKAADLLGLNRNTLRKKIRELDIEVTKSASISN
jgi:two-component system nitrogen regulation response regulator GlnG